MIRYLGWIVLAAMPFVILSEMSAAQTIVFTNVNVVPMDKERVLKARTVVVRNGVIAEIGKNIRVPSGAQVIDGEGKYLMPGLADMHVHIFGEDELRWYVANGVTTLRNMWGFDSHLKMRSKIVSGELLGPNIFSAGAIVDGDPPQLRGSAVVRSAQDADDVVKSQKQAGYDFIKIYNRLKPDAYDAVIAAAHKYGLKVVGHIPKEVDLEHALDQKQYSIEHLYGYPELARRDAAGAPAKWEDPLDDQKLRRLAEKTREAGSWNCPTLIVALNLELSREEIDKLLQRREMAFLPRQIKRMFPKPDAADPEIDPDVRRRSEANRSKVVMALAQAKAKLLLGTDTGNPYTLPGFAVHQELQLLVAAGLTPFEALQTSTINAAVFLGRNDLGTISKGKRADLILVSGNPLENVSNAARIAGVSVQGKWLDEAALRWLIEGK